MAGYLSTSKSLSVTDTCWSHVDNDLYYGDTATATVTVTAGKENSANYDVTVTTSDYNFIKIYLELDGIAVLNEKDTRGKKEYTYSGSGTISGDTVDIKLGVGCSQYTTSTMTFTTGTLTRTKWEDISGGTIKITDNYNNTFTISASKAKDGTNNPVASHKVSWGYNSDYDSYTGSGNGLKSLTVSGKAATRTVYVRNVSLATYGPDDIQTASKAIRQYIAPNAPGKPVISYTKKRLTLREPWTFTWNAAAAANTSSPLKGYRIHIIKNGTALTGLVSGPNNTIIKGTNANNWIDRDSTSHTITFDPVELGFEVGDTVSVGIFSYTRYGENNTGSQLFNGGGVGDAQVISDVSTVENAGIVHVKVGSSWKEGQVYIKAGGVWKEAESVYTKVSGSWKESQ